MKEASDNESEIVIEEEEEEEMFEDDPSVDVEFKKKREAMKEAEQEKNAEEMKAAEAKEAEEMRAAEKMKAEEEKKAKEMRAAKEKKVKEKKGEEMQVEEKKKAEEMKAPEQKAHEKEAEGQKSDDQAGATFTKRMSSLGLLQLVLDDMPCVVKTPRHAAPAYVEKLAPVLRQTILEDFFSWQEAGSKLNLSEKQARDINEVMALAIQLREASLKLGADSSPALKKYVMGRIRDVCTTSSQDMTKKDPREEIEVDSDPEKPRAQGGPYKA